MRKKLVASLFFCIFSLSKLNAQVPQTFHDFWGITIFGDTISFSQWAGKKLLIVNTASYCAYTPQFDDLQALDSTYQNNNFEVIGFPCNDFGNQDPGEDSTINNFCTGTYGVQFQMMSKVGIKLPDTADCYKWLQWQYLNGVANAQVTWNFHKFCIDEAGGWVAHYPSQTLPFDTAIVNWILYTPPVSTGIESGVNPDQTILIKNPVTDNFELKLNLKSKESFHVEVLNSNGSQVFFQNYNFKNGENIINIAALLPQGLYLIKVSGKNFNKIIKTLKL